MRHSRCDSPKRGMWRMFTARPVEPGRRCPFQRPPAVPREIGRVGDMPQQAAPLEKRSLRSPIRSDSVRSFCRGVPCSRMSRIASLAPAP